MRLPPWFDSSRLSLDTESYDGMLSLDDKNYVIFNNGKLTKHGSGLKGRHLPVLCDRFIDDLCWALFNGIEPIEVYQRYVDLSKFPRSDFYFNISLGKKRYSKKSMYYKIAKLADVNASLHILKTAEGYELQGKPDYNYYKKRLGDLAERITGDKARKVREYLLGQRKLESS